MSCGEFAIMAFVRRAVVWPGSIMVRCSTFPQPTDLMIVSGSADVSAAVLPTA